MTRHAEMHDPAREIENDEHEEPPEPYRRNDEQVDGDRLVEMIP